MARIAYLNGGDKCGLQRCDKVRSLAWVNQVRYNQGMSNQPALRLRQVNQAAPNFTLPATDGTNVELSAYLKPVALVFLRHLA